MTPERDCAVTVTVTRPLKRGRAVGLWRETMANNPHTPGRLAEARLLTVAEVATLLRVSKMTVYRMVHSGSLAAVRVGRSLRVPHQAVDTYLRVAYQESV